MKLIKSCGACAIPLPDLGAKQCSNCKTRYCGPACQVQHWREGGHDKLCKKIKKAGGAEQYYADKKCAEAIALAVEECADDTKGQTCFICTEALHRKTKEGLVRGCACRGTAGFAHVSCLAEQAKILVAEAEEKNSDDIQWHRWDTCSLCEQDYHGVVACALGWACWKTYLGRPADHWTRRANNLMLTSRGQVRSMAMNVLGCGLSLAARAGHDEDASSVHEARLSVFETRLSILRRHGVPREQTLPVLSHLTGLYQELERHEEAMRMARDAYDGHLEVYGGKHRGTLVAASEYAFSLFNLERFEEAKVLLRRTIPMARHVLGEENVTTLRMRGCYAETLYTNDDATLDEKREAVKELGETTRTARHVLGDAHPLTVQIEDTLGKSLASLAREGGWG
jgi:hypothetical protein